MKILADFVNGIGFGSMIFLVACGLLIVLGIMRVVNLMHGALFMLGGYITASLATRAVGMLGGLVVAAAAMAVLSLALVPVIHLFKSVMQQAMVTFGGLFIIESVSLWVWGGTPRVVTLSGFLAGSVMVGNQGVANVRLVLIGVGAIVAIGMLVLERRTLLGARIRAVVDDPDIAESMGMNKQRLNLGALVVAGALAGLAGGLGNVFIAAAPGADLTAMLLAITVVIVGGMGSVVGAIVVSLGLGLISDFGAVYFAAASQFTTYVPLLLVLAFRPSGLFSRAGD